MKKIMTSSIKKTRTNLFLNSFTKSIQLLVKPDEERGNLCGRARLFGPECFPELDRGFEDVAEEGDGLPLNVAHRRALHLAAPVTNMVNV